ncbi:MAG: hypothetical protein U0324_04980 [Polyangiales bacterium]
MKPAKKPPTPPPPASPHKRAVEAIQALFQLVPREAAEWLYQSVGGRDKVRILEATYIEQPRRAPAYVVPAPRPPPAPKTPDEHLSQALTDLLRSDLEREAEASGGDIRVERISIDWDEERRQTLLKGGCDVELRVRYEAKAGKTGVMLLGFMFPEPDDDGTETPWKVLEKSVWHMQMWPTLVAKDHPELQYNMSFAQVPVYLWPGTGLKDPQENCSVTKGDPVLPGLLGALLSAQKESEADRKRDRKSNLGRQTFHRRLDRARRAAAAKRLALMGDAGISPAELAALVPEIDLDLDRISLQVLYPITRLWESPVDALIKALPPECVGLALFGHRGAGVSFEDALHLCGWSLRRALRDAPPARVARAVSALAAVARAHLDDAAIERTLRAMKLR